MNKKGDTNCEANDGKGKERERGKRTDGTRKTMDGKWVRGGRKDGEREIEETRNGDK